jgi:hypothetical protein
MFRITGLSPDLFCHLVGLSDAELVALNARRVVADRANAFPDRIEMRDAEPGEVLILANYEHLQGATPYRARHAVYFLEQATERYDTTDTVPDVFRNRLISLRAFDTADMMLDADAVAGEELAEAISRFFLDARVSYLHAHYAKPGCYAARVDRA